ncbi:glycosyl hydrolase [Tabrizicola sp.]|uniref:glycosyl hydrolase n=1 Tax=Tabrizicola sp. TaxID=2005166 RepID=UPI00286A3DE6|nr:glycosyl hydrolase [Tabrizicola sp.]
MTIEPWTWTRDERNTALFLRRGIADGYHDANMRGICKVIGTLQSPVSVRWAHEMDDNDGQFIWAAWAPEDYISAFRRMIDICRAEAPNISVLWSPLGREGMEKYYPGDDYVDRVGISIFGLEPYEIKTYGAPQNL